MYVKYITFNNNQVLLNVFMIYNSYILYCIKFKFKIILNYYLNT